MTRTRINKNIPIQLGDKEAQKEFQEFLNEKSKKPATNELATHGGFMDQIKPLDYAGVYNPDNVTIDIYNKMKANPQLNAGLKLIKLPIMGQNWTPVCKESKEIEDYIHKAFNPLWLGLLGSSLTCVDYGFSGHEKVFRIEDGLYYPHKFKSLYPEWLQMVTDKKDNFDGIKQLYKSNEIKIPLNKSLVITQNKGDSFGNLFGESRLKPCYETWYWWVTLMQFMLRYFEKKATPPIIVRFPPGKDRSGIAHADTALHIGKAVLSDSVVALSSSLNTGGTDRERRKWEIEYLLDDKRGEMFVSVLTYLDAKLLRGLFIPERVFTQDTTSKAGSYSLSKVHADMFLLGEEGLLVDIEDQLNRYAVRKLVELNFGKNAPPCSIKIERITDARKVFLKDVFMTMLKSGNAIPAVKQIAEFLGVPMDEKGNIGKSEENENNKKEKPEEKKASENCGCSVNLEDEKKRQWWREPKESENVKVLGDIEDFLDTKQEVMKTKLIMEVLNPQIDQIIIKTEKFLKNKLPLKDIWYKIVKIPDPVATNGTKNERVTWKPLVGIMSNILKDFMRGCYIFGQESAIEELKVDLKPQVDKDISNILQAKAAALADRFFSNVKYETELSLLVASNKTQKDLLDDIKGKVRDKLKNVNINQMVETESMEFLNRGRAVISNKLS